MFGYINVNGKELSEENKKRYQSYYCGLCKKLQTQYGAKGQLLLNYDMTFLVVLLTALYESPAREEKFVCKLHPFSKRTYTQSEITEYAAGMNVLLGYYHLMDDWRDDGNLPKKAFANALKEDVQALGGKYPRQAKAVENYIEKLLACEERNEANIDLVAGLTGEMLGELFAWKEDEWYDELKTLGFYMGKFIYLMDAYEDLSKDEKKDRYNPFKQLKKEHENDFECLCKLMMTSMMSEAARSFERLPILEMGDILRNIIYSGVWSKYEFMQRKKEEKE